ncbi:MAG: amino acid ABC transporter permease [Thermoguttaceae bacterium]|nr:amino acid ABC transporter permease [Thermoguttaceae bacterium]
MQSVAVSPSSQIDTNSDACDNCLSLDSQVHSRILETKSSRFVLFGDASGTPNAGGSQSEPFIPERKSFWEKQRRSFEKTFIVEGRWRLFANGLAVTLGITIASTILGTFFAFLQCCMRRSTCKWLRYPAKVYIALMQGTPILVILLIMYYVVFAKFQAPWGLEKEIVATISLALNFAAYAGEMMRTGVDSIDKGLIEAARALGFGRFQVFSKVIFPIATRRIIPVYKGEFISLLKTTSIVGYIATQDLTKASDIVRARTYEAFFPLIATAIIYLLSAHLLASVFAYMEYRLNPVNRRKRAKGEVNV